MEKPWFNMFSGSGRRLLMNEKIIKTYCQQGKSDKVIARLVGCKMEAVRKVRIRFGFPLQNHGYIKDEIMQLRHEGVKLTEIADKLGCYFKYVVRICTSTNLGICSCGKKTKNEKLKYCPDCNVEINKHREIQVCVKRDKCKCGNYKLVQSDLCIKCHAKKVAITRVPNCKYTKDKAIRLRRRGLSLTEIVEKLGCSPHTVNEACGSVDAGICSCGKKIRNKKFRYCSDCRVELRKYKLFSRPSERNRCICGNPKLVKSNLCGKCAATSRVRSSRYTEQELIQMYKDLEKKMGRRITSTIWKKEGFPDANHVIRTFGKWNKFVSIAEGENEKG